MNRNNLKKKVLEANIRFHEELITRGFYAQQPFLNTHNQKRVYRIIKGLVKKSGDDTLLDVGCGTGFILGIASNIFKQLVGVDISTKILDSVPCLPNLKLHIAKAEKLPFPDKSFNVITLYGVLHHIFDLEPPLREIYRCLKPGGCIYADESPNSYCIKYLRSINLDDKSVSNYLKEHASSVQNDVSVYERRYNIDPEITRMAMYRDKVLGGIEEDEIRGFFSEIGFTEVEYNYRWFLGQGNIFGSGFDYSSKRIEDYLHSLLPLTRPLFKYISIVAWKRK